MKRVKLSQIFLVVSVCSTLFCNVSTADDNVFIGDSKWQKSLIKNGFYRSLGFYSGYYYYGEVDTRKNDAEVMHMDLLMFGLMGQIGHISQGIKLEGTLRLNYALGLYTGGILDADNPDRNGKPVKSIDGASMGDIGLKGGYNLLKHSSYTSLYLQTGLGYFLNRNELTSMKRIQGYLYVPLEVEGEVLLNQKLAFTYGGGYRYFIFGNHLSENTTTERGKLKVTQKQGFGFSAFIGANFFTKSQELRLLRLVYEYWSVGDSKTSPMVSVYTGDTHYFYEPKNSTHRVFIQYSFGF